MSTLSIKNISMNYKKVKALKDISLEIEENKIYGLLGRNGAGKSTLLNLITNKLFQSSGTITIDGENNIENSTALSKIHCCPNLHYSQNI